MLKLLNVVDFFGIGLDFDFNDTMFWLYVAQGVLVFIGIILFFVLLARTRSRREKVVEKVIVTEQQPDKAELLLR